mgnify:CR=1 FL=1
MTSPITDSAPPALAPDMMGRGEYLGQGLSWERYEITPDWARTLLGMENESNDRRDQPAVNEYAAVMRNGGWVFNGQPIVFSDKGHLIDGFQRLFACIQADTPFDTAIVYGVDPAAAHTIDQHARRSYQNVLESRGWRNVGAIVRVAAWLLRYRRGDVGMPPSKARSISWVRLDRFIADHPAIREGVDLAIRITHSSPVPAFAREIVAVIGCALGRKEDTIQFLKDLTPHEELSLSGNLRPGQALTLQARMMRSNGLPLPTLHAIALTLLAFDDHLCQRPAVTYEWKADFGDAPLRDDGRPSSWVGANVTQNIGLPTPESFPAELRPLPTTSKTSKTGIRISSFTVDAGALSKSATASPRVSYEQSERAPMDETALFDDQPGTLASNLRRLAAESPSTVSMKIVTVSPAKAQEWLSSFNYKNRRLQKTNVSSFVRDMRAGEWRLNGQPICFSTENRLINGQHRLEAVSEAGVDIDVLVMTGLADEAFATYDMQARKPVALNLPGDEADDAEDGKSARRSLARTYEPVIEAAAKMLWRDENDGYRSGMRVTASEVRDTLKRHPKLVDGYQQARRMFHIASNGVMTYLIYVVTKEDPVIGQEFLDSLDSGANLSANNPLLKARDTIIAARAKRSRLDASKNLKEVWRTYYAWRKKQPPAQKAIFDDEAAPEGEQSN